MKVELDSSIEYADIDAFRQKFIAIKTELDRMDVKDSNLNKELNELKSKHDKLRNQIAAEI